MKKIKIPELLINTDLPEKMSKKEFEEMYENSHYEFVPNFEFDVRGLYVVAGIGVSDEGDYLYAYIHSDGVAYYDYAIIKTDDFHFSTYSQYKKAMKALEQQLVSRWKEWVKGLYEK